MILLVTPRIEKALEWRARILERMPAAQLRVWPEIGDPAQIDVALTWKAPPGVLGSLPGLRLICSLGMGVDHVLDDATVPRHVPITRLVDQNMVDQMCEYVLYAVLHYHRQFHRYDRFQRERRWEELPLPHTPQRRVGILGMGTIGSPCARRLVALGFDVGGWSRTRRSVEGVACWAGTSTLGRFLARSEIVVCLLPLTGETQGIINAGTLAELPRGACFINVARGGLVVEGDLLAALDSGVLGEAMLDVAAVEPLPQDHALWRHPRVRITPHIAGLTNPATAADAIVENLGRLERGLPLLHLVDRVRGY